MHYLGTSCLQFYFTTVLDLWLISRYSWHQVQHSRLVWYCLNRHCLAISMYLWGSAPPSPPLGLISNVIGYVPTMFLFPYDQFNKLRGTRTLWVLGRQQRGVGDRYTMAMFIVFISLLWDTGANRRRVWCRIRRHVNNAMVDFTFSMRYYWAV